ncbi:hypothetical protein GOBAR_DD16663 [Gossypium barbadense]|nr:hypothetical protein GOBAR_DD16663 [Gossypium barbadense]
MKARLAVAYWFCSSPKEEKREVLFLCLMYKRGKEALDYFKEDPELFDMTAYNSAAMTSSRIFALNSFVMLVLGQIVRTDVLKSDIEAAFWTYTFCSLSQYHAGYQEQMSHWPELPVNIIIKWLKERSSSLIVADFGCGDARLAKNVKNKVFSIDLVSNDPSVISCDMSKTPLRPSSVDVAVFCLSLMGTNYASYLKEACRVLKPSGWLLIAEVKSRFDPNNGGADPNMFSKAVCEMGFTSALKDFSNKMFVLLYFKKKENKSSNGREIEWPELKPCIYKRR